ncbi:MLO-like protein 12 [Rosa rugosa]|uniref:MLO-like protein 12 n=1 Tax=Rosa rugosa TaxID=74645 RepID=UPI002B4138F5|nr:MLO-like protein 12 [Rosa rugosa]
MAGEEVSSESTTLESTPTWAVATVCFVLIFISILIEHLLHLLAHYFNKIRRKSLILALDKIKSELMLLGFISLLLTVGQKPIANICIPKAAGESFLPCQSYTLSEDIVEETKCAEQGKVSLMSRSGANELQYFIFVLALFHVLSCVLTSTLGFAKMKSWQSWEAETRTMEYQFSYDPRRFQLAHQTSFGKRHLKCWSDHRILRWPACFARQFFSSVSKVDYFTLRHGFITAHFAEGSNFDFHKYIRRALEKDYGVVMTTSWWIWMYSVFVIFLNAHGFYNYLWVPFIPLLMLLLVGTKLQGIITKMCVDSHDKSHVVRGTLLVKPSDHFFWFGWPKLLLHILHFILYQNSFQLAFFTWTWYKFGLKSCFHRETEDIVIRLAMGIMVQILCGYVTLPLYALVTQMGTSMRKAVFTETVVTGLKKWRGRARKNLALKSSARMSLDASLQTSLSLDTTLSFNHIDASASFSTVDFDAEYVAVEIMDNAGNVVQGKQVPEGEDRDQKPGPSFDGFDLSSSKKSQR